MMALRKYYPDVGWGEQGEPQRGSSGKICWGALRLPQPTQPEATQPEATQPEATKLKAAKPELTNPDPSDHRARRAGCR